MTRERHTWDRLTVTTKQAMILFILFNAYIIPPFFLDLASNSLLFGRFFSLLLCVWGSESLFVLGAGHWWRRLLRGEA